MGLLCVAPSALGFHAPPSATCDAAGLRRATAVAPAAGRRRSFAPPRPLAALPPAALGGAAALGDAVLPLGQHAVDGLELGSSLATAGLIEVRPRLSLNEIILSSSSVSPMLAAPSPRVRAALLAGLHLHTAAACADNHPRRRGATWWRQFERAAVRGCARTGRAMRAHTHARPRPLRCDDDLAPDAMRSPHGGCVGGGAWRRGCCRRVRRALSQALAGIPGLLLIVPILAAVVVSSLIIWFIVASSEPEESD